MKRFRRKKRIRFNTNIIIIIIILLLLSTFFVISFIGKKMEPGILNYAEKEARKLITIIARSSINDELINELNTNSLFITDNNQDNTKTIDINPVTLNTFIKDVTTNIQYNLKCIEEGKIEDLKLDKNVLARYDEDNLKKGIFVMMPTGVVFNNPLLINLSPNIPLKMSFIGDVISDIDTHVTNYGINNALIEISLKVKVNMQVLLPTRSNEISTELSFPIVTKMVQGITPNLYYNGLFKNN